MCNLAVTKHFLAHEMERGCKASGVKRIRIHDIRHSHVSLLIEMGSSALAIAERIDLRRWTSPTATRTCSPRNRTRWPPPLTERGVSKMPCENSARKRSKTMAFRCTPEEHKLICEMAAWVA